MGPEPGSGVDYDLSRALAGAHRLGLLKLYMLTLDGRPRLPACSFTSGPGNEILGAWERTEQTLTALVGMEIG